MARLEKIGTPSAMLEALSAGVVAANEAAQAEARSAEARGARRKRALMWLGGGFAGFFVLQPLLSLVDVEFLYALGPVSVFCALSYGAVLLFKSGGVVRPPKEDQRLLQVAHEVLLEIAPDLADETGTLWVVTDPIETVVVSDRQKKPGGKWRELRVLEWFQLEAKAGDGATWTIGAKLLRTDKIKPKRGGTKRRTTHEERVFVRLQLPASAPLADAQVAAIGRLGARRSPVSNGLQILRARARPRKVELELTLSERARRTRVQSATGSGGFLATYIAGTRAQLHAQEILLAAALIARVRGAQGPVGVG